MALVPWVETSHVLAEVKNEDAVFVLAYSIIMLNTDLHNPQIRVIISDPLLVILRVYTKHRKK
jgi:hypothetical protein